MERSHIDFDNKDSVRVDKTKRSVAYFCLKQPARVDRKLIDKLKKNASVLKDKNIRICLHDTPDAPFQNMIILEHKDRYYRPHKHLDKGESFHIIEGRMAVFAFDDAGDIIDSCILEQGGSLIYKVPVNSYHAIMPLTDPIIYHEAKPGPFLGAVDSIFPAWSVEEGDKEGMDKYRRMLVSALKKNCGKSI